MRRATRLAWIAAAGGMAGIAAARLTGPRAAHRVTHRIGSELGHRSGQARGVAYRLTGRHPADDAGDLILADRVRSSLGPLEKSLDLPRLHVMVGDGVALLHGEVASEEDLVCIEAAVRGVAGITGVRSCLHMGLIPADTRPSVGRAAEGPSPAKTALLDAAIDAGANGGADEAVRAVLGTLAERLPAGQRRRLFGHLPADVRAMATPAHWVGHGLSRVRSVSELVLAVLAQDPDLPAGRAKVVLTAILGALYTLASQDASGVAAVLPHELRNLWEEARIEAGTTAWGRAPLAYR